jgi:hypothetical protein
MALLARTVVGIRSHMGILHSTGMEGIRPSMALVVEVVLRGVGSGSLTDGVDSGLLVLGHWD